MFIEPESGEVSVLLLLIVTPLNELTLDPERVVVPPNVEIPEPALRVPLFIMFPSYSILIVGVIAAPLLMVTGPNLTMDPPLIDVVPLNVNELPAVVKIDVPLATKLPPSVTE